MSHNIDRDMKLRGLVLKGSESCMNSACALERAIKGAGLPVGSVWLSTFGQRLGYSEAESFGIMDGWDRSAGLSMCFDNECFDNECPDSAGYKSGKELGTLLYQMVFVGQQVLA